MRLKCLVFYSAVNYLKSSIFEPIGQLAGVMDRCVTTPMYLMP